MRLRAKAAGLLITGFTLMFALMAATSMIALKKNQDANLKAFRNEFSEASLELFDNNAELFFKYFEAKLAGGDISNKEDAIFFSIILSLKIETLCLLIFKTGALLTAISAPA
jgi:hypothetical protein